MQSPDPIPSSSRDEKDLDLILASVLRTGLLCSCAVMILGAVMHIGQTTGSELRLQQFTSEPQQLRTISGIVKLALTGNSLGIMQLAVVILLATPFLRVVFAAFAFARERDWKYVAISLIVLAALVFGLYWGHGSAG